MTDKTEIHAEGTDTDSWIYTIKGLTAGQRYTLRQNLPAYDAEGLEEIEIEVSADAAPVMAELGEIREELRTRSVRGLIEWDGYNPAVKPVESLDFLRVYEGSQDVTDRVDLELVSTSFGNADTDTGKVWAYAVDGLLESRNYTIRAESPEGYAVFPSEIGTGNGRTQYLRSGRSAGAEAGIGMLQTFTVRNVEPVELKIENVYHGEAGDLPEFTYLVEYGDPKQSETKKITATGTAIISLPIGTAYSVTQENGGDQDISILYDESKMQTQTGTLSGDTTVSFINLKKHTLDYQKQWNDNGNAAGGRPAPSKTAEASEPDRYFTDYLHLKVKKSGNYIDDEGELAKLGLHGISPDITPQANFWTIHYDHLPLKDETGSDLTYELTEDVIPGYKLTYSSAEGTDYEQILVNTSYTTFTATKAWMDNHNHEISGSAGDITPRDTIDEYVSRLTLYYEDHDGDQHKVKFQSEDDTAENYLLITPIMAQENGTQDNWTIEVKNLVQFDGDGMPYAYYLVETEGGWSVEGTDPEFEIHYVPTYNNPHNYINEKARCYTGGTITNKLEGLTNFTFYKKWEDGRAAAADRPDIAFQLMRYPGNLDPKEGYIHAAPVEVKKITTPEDKEKMTGEIIWKTGDGKLLPRFNAEGVEYVYFVEEKLSAGNSADYVQHVKGIGAEAPKLAVVNHEFNKDLVADGETLINRLEKTVNIPVTKTWESAAFQDVDAEVVLKVTRVSANPANTNVEEVFFDPELTISGFTPETITQSITVDGMPVYDTEGYRYTYTISESAIRLKTEYTDGEYLPLVFDEGEKVYKTTKAHYPSHQYKFETTSSNSAGETILTNTLKDRMNVRVDKIWPDGWREPGKDYAVPESLTFTLYQDGKEYKAAAVTNPVTVLKPELDPQIEGGEQKGICSFNDLPRYDEKGHEYVYTVKEEVYGNVGIITYSYNWEYGAWKNAEDKDIDTRAVDITNPPPGDGKGFWIEKQWLDDGDKPHREDVTVAVYKKGADNSTWTKHGEVVLKEDGEWRRHYGIGPTDDPKDYAVRELKIGNASVTYAGESSNGLPSETGTATTSKHTYNVSNAFLDGEWRITNLRTGTVKIAVTKAWLDDAMEDSTVSSGDVTKGGRPIAARFQLVRDGAPLSNTERDTICNKSQGEDASGAMIEWTDFPKYDETGRLYAYSVKETAVRVSDTGNDTGDWVSLENGNRIEFTGADGETHFYVSGITGGAYVHDGDIIPFHAENRRQEAMEIHVYKVWKDDGPEVEGKRVRPDIHFRLYRMLKKDLGDQPPTDVTKMEPVTVGKTIAEANDYQEKYVFDPVPRYNSDGHEYVYFVQEGMDGNSSNYEASYYQCAPNGLATAQPTTNLLQLSGTTGTVVNRRTDAVHVSGEKIWKLMGGLELEDYPSVTLRLQSRVMYKDNGEINDGPYTDVAKPGTAGQCYECILGAEEGGSKNYNYEFIFKEGQTNFPKYNEDGKELAYYVKEVAINGEAVVEGVYQRTSGDRSFVLENTYQDKGACQVQVTKSWIDVPAGEEGPKATIELYRVMVDSKGNALGYTKKLYRSEVLDYEKLGDISQTQTIKFENLPKYAPNGRLYQYSVEEKTIGGYDISIAPEGTFTFKNGTKQDVNIDNKYNPLVEDPHGAVTVLQGVKKWADSGNKYGTRPDDAKNIKLTLHRNYPLLGGGSSADEAFTEAEVHIEWVLNNGSSETDEFWVYKITMADNTKFPKYAPNGKEYRYWVTETLAGESDTTLPNRYIPGTSTPVTVEQMASNDKALSITNTPQFTKLAITKQWEDNENRYQTRPGAIQVEIQRRVKTETDTGAWAAYGSEIIDAVQDGISQTVNKSYPAYEKDEDQNKILGPYEYRAVELVPVGYEVTEVHNTTAEASTLSSSSKLTNTLEVHGDDAVNLKAEKVWEDQNDQDGFRSGTVTIELYRRAKGSSDEGQKVREQIISKTPASTTTADVTLDEWCVTWKSLPRYMPSESTSAEKVEAEYYVKEAMPAEAKKYYQTTMASASDANTTTWSLTNTHTPFKVSIEVEKKWEDMENRWGTRPDSVEIFLMRTQNGQPGEHVKDENGQDLKAELKASGNWTVTFSGLPYAANGIPYSYYAEEAVVPGYTSGESTKTIPVVDGTTENPTGHVSITNTIQTTSAQMTKRWVDSGNVYGTRPETITFTLYRKAGENGVYGQVDETLVPLKRISGEALKSDTMEVEFTNLPTRDKEGQLYVYQIRETSMQFEGIPSPYDVTWSEDGMAASLQPNPIVYEVGVSSEEPRTITNTLKSCGSIRVIKAWGDKDDQDGIRPDPNVNPITVELYRRRAGDEDWNSNPWKTEKLKWNEAIASWSAEWNDLPYRAPTGEEYEYCVKEQTGISPYTAYYKLEPSGAESGTPPVISPSAFNDETAQLTVTNRYTPKTMQIKATKQWIGDGDGSQSGRPESVVFELYQTIAGGDENPVKVPDADKTVSAAGPDGAWTAIWTDLPVKSNGKDITYYVREEASIEGYGTSYVTTGTTRSGVTNFDNQSAGLTGDIMAPSGSGANAKEITVRNTLNAKTTAGVKKIWNDKISGNSWPASVEKVSFGLQRRYSDLDGSNPWTAVSDATNNPIVLEIPGADGAVDSPALVENLPLYDTTNSEPQLQGLKYEYRIIEKFITIKAGNAEKTIAVTPDSTNSDPDAAGTIGNYAFTTTVSPAADGSVTTITNTWQTRDIHAEKVWQDEDDRDGKRPDTITLELYKTETGSPAPTRDTISAGSPVPTGRRIILDGSADSNADTAKDYENAPWKAVWKDLPMRTPEGGVITYTVEEVKTTVPDGYTVSTPSHIPDDPVYGGTNHDGTSEAAPLLVVNTREPETTTYTIEKLWLGDDEWKDDTRPDSIQIQLYMVDAVGNPAAVGNPVQLKPNADGRWTHTWTDLYKYQNQGQEIRYYAKEIGVDGYTSLASSSNMEGMISNTMNTTSLKVTKEWEDGDDEYGIRPDSIRILLQRKLRNAAAWETLPESKAVFDMDGADGWGTVEFTGLPTHNKHNQPYEYRAVEVEIGGERTDRGRAAGYEAVYEHHPNLLTVPGETKITNRLVSGSLEVAKTLKSGAAADFSFRVELTVDGTKTFTKEITVHSGESFRIDGIPAGTAYTVTELETNGYILDGKTGDTGVIRENVTARAEFTNRRKSSGGGGGGGGGNTPQKPTDSANPMDPTGPAGPGVPTEPAGPDAPSEPEAPTESTGMTLPEGPTLPDIPTTPDKKPNVPKGTHVEVRDPGNPGGPPVYRGSYTGVFDNVPSGRYLLVTLDDEGVPLANLLIFIDDGGVPLALPKTGDTGIPIALLAAAFIGSAAGLVLLRRRKREDEDQIRPQS